MIDNLFGGQDQLINILGGVGFFFVVGITAYVMWVYVKKIKNDRSEGKLAEESWDGIGEYKNDLPIGWNVITLILIVWAFWYWFIGYPVDSYSQLGQWNVENEEYKAKFENTWQNADKDTLVAMGESIFLAKCAPCHGLTADGNNGQAADLTTYGHQAHIEYVIKHGSKGLGYPGGEMPAGLVKDEATIKKIASYVAKGLKGDGKDEYVANCAGCHGEDGKGMFGTFPDLTAYGSEDFAIKVIKHGKDGHIGFMPSYTKEGTLTELQYKAVASYILSLGQ